LTLGGKPLHSFSDYLQISQLIEESRISDGHIGVSIVIDNLSVLIQNERQILNLAADAEDEGTVSLMSGCISQTEKKLCC